MMTVRTALGWGDPTGRQAVAGNPVLDKRRDTAPPHKAWNKRVTVLRLIETDANLCNH
jgi:hypothetical protein